MMEVARRSSAASSMRREKIIAAAMIAAFVLLAIGYSLIPVFEGQDEPEHYYYIHYLAETGQLPNREDPDHWEVHQAPLYYLLAVPVKLLLPDRDFDQVYRQRLMDAPSHTFVPAVNFSAHSLREDFPYSGSETALAVHLLRLYSIALATGTMLVCYAVFRTLWPNQPEVRLLALGFVCFWPQFLAVSAWINNDNLLNLLAALALLLLLRMLASGPTWKGAALLGVVLGAALLTKIAALFLAIPVAVFFAIDWRRSWRYAVLTLGLVLAIAGWWYLRNGIVYNDPLGLEAQYAALPDIRRDPLALPVADNLNQLWYLYSKVWISFGFYTNVKVPLVFQLIFVVWLVGAISGAALSFLRWRNTATRDEIRARIVSPQTFLLVSFAASLLVAASGFALTNQYGIQGRYVFPGLAIWAALLAAGWAGWIPMRLRWQAAMSAAALNALVSLIALLGYYLPAYQIPPLPAEIAHPLHLRYGAIVELLGSDHDQIGARPGDIVEVNLYWRALNATPDPLIFDLHTSGSTLFAVQTLPANGKLLPNLWLTGQSWSEKYRLSIPKNASPGDYQMYVLIFDTTAQAFLPITTADGTPVRAPIAVQIVIQ